MALAFAIALCLIAGLLAGCTPNSPSDPTADPTPTPTDAVTPVSIVPVTPDGLSTGRGVTDDDITLGLLVDADRDRGFGRGVEFWRTSVNNAGGICGRRIELLGNGRGGLPDEPVDAYDTVALNSLGLITLAGRDQEAALNGRVSADQIPTLTSEGTAEQLGPDRPIIVGATDDVLVINVLDTLRDSGRLADGDSIGMLSDDSPSARNAVQGARWWGERRGVTVDLRTVSPDGGTDLAAEVDDALTTWGDAAAVLAFVPADAAGIVVAAAPAAQPIVMLPDAYRPAGWSEQARAAAGRVFIGLPTPAAGSDHPATSAVVGALAREGAEPLDVRVLTGYATATSWGRLLTAACEERLLTRRGIEEVIGTVGPAPPDALFGPSDPALPIQAARPATLESAVGQGAPTTPNGITAVTALVSADGIDSYAG